MCHLWHVHRTLNKNVAYSHMQISIYMTVRRVTRLKLFVNYFEYICIFIGSFFSPCFSLHLLIHLSTYKKMPLQSAWTSITWDVKVCTTKSVNFPEKNASYKYVPVTINIIWAREMVILRSLPKANVQKDFWDK